MRSSKQIKRQPISVIRGIWITLPMLFLLSISGNPVINRNPNVSVLISLAALFAVIYSLIKFGKAFWTRFLAFVAFTLAIYTIQYFNLGWLSFDASIGFLAKFTIGSTIIWFYREQAIAAYFNVMFALCVVSLVFYVLSFTGFSLPNLFPVYDVPSLRSVFFYIQATPFSLRNQGMFWEPGAFAGYIVLAIMLRLLFLPYAVWLRSPKILVMICALLTTFSTSGYLLVFLVLVANNLRGLKRNFALGFILFVLMASFSVYLFNRLDFLGEKIKQQYETSLALEGEYDPSRFGAFLFDVHYIKKNPFTGNGFHERTRYSDHPHLFGDRAGHGNGFSNFIACMGILSMGFYLFMFKAVSGLSLFNKFVFYLIIIALLQGQQFLDYPLFLGLPFLSTFYEKNSRFTYLPQ